MLFVALRAVFLNTNYQEFIINCFTNNWMKIYSKKKIYGIIRD